jgi:hypothetical protein
VGQRSISDSAIQEDTSVETSSHYYRLNSANQSILFDTFGEVVVSITIVDDCTLPAQSAEEATANERRVGGEMRYRVNRWFVEINAEPLAEQQSGWKLGLVHSMHTVEGRVSVRRGAVHK